MNRIAPPSIAYNCHGYTFTGGQRVMSIFSEVDKILNDQYRKLENTSPLSSTPLQVGDVIIYRSNGDAIHSGIVYSIGYFGTPIIISKWGTLGLFTHGVNNVPYTYTETGVIEFWRPVNGQNLIFK